MYVTSYMIWTSEGPQAPPAAAKRFKMHGRVLLLEMALWLGLTAWILTICCTGMGHIVNESGLIFIFWGPMAPPDIKRPRIFTELIEIYRLVGSNRKTEVGTPPKNL